MTIRDSLRSNLLEFTRTAFNMLTIVKNPSILDIGCGSGVQTIELARISNGHIMAIDIDRVALNTLRLKTKELNLSDRISIVELSMMELHKIKMTFDIIWAEGSIFAVGFEKGIRDWKQLLREDGFLVIHDDDSEMASKLQTIARHRYELLGLIEVSHEEHWNRYYKHLEILLTKEKLDDVQIGELQREIKNFKKSKNGSIFFILQNKSL